MKIGITGSSGAIGRHLHAAKPLMSRLGDEKKTIIEEFKQKELDVIIHLAGITDSQVINQNPDYAYEINVKGSLKLMESLIDSGGKRFVFVSTGHVYGPNFRSSLCREVDPVNPISVYAEQKMIAEQQLAQLAKDENIELVLARVFSVFGKGLAPHYLSALVERSISNGKEFPRIRTASDIRDFSTPEQVAHTLMFLARLERSTPLVINLGSGNACTVRDRVLLACPSWPKTRFDDDFSEIPYLVPSIDKLLKLKEVNP